MLVRAAVPAPPQPIYNITIYTLWSPVRAAADSCTLYYYRVHNIILYYSHMAAAGTRVVPRAHTMVPTPTFFDGSREKGKK